MHFSLILLSNDTSYNYGRIIKDAMEPYHEVWDEIDPRTVMGIDDGDVYWYNPNGKWDWYQFGGRWCGLIKAKRGSYGERSWTNKDMEYECGHFDAALVKNIVSIDPEMIYSVLTPDGTWHDCETFHDELRNEEHPYGQFIKDETFKTDFKRRFLDPYMDCRAFVIDYHC